MPLTIGNKAATEGLTREIFENIKAEMEPIDGVSGDALEDVRDSWRKLAFAIAGAVIDHIRTNMEVHGVTTSGDINTGVSGVTGADSGHTHNVNLNGQQSGVVFTQNNDGTGHIS